jgi:hypothetical protein
MNEIAKIEEGCQIQGLYTIKECLGSGGIGIVHRAKHAVWEIDLAIKRPLAKFLKYSHQLENFFNPSAKHGQV